MAKILTSSLNYKGPATENLIEFVRNGLRKHSDQTIVIDSKSDRRWTGRELEKQVALVAKYLLDECNLEKGDVCCLYGEPDDIVVILILAVIAAGGTCNLWIHKYRPQEVYDTAKILKAKFLISSNALLQTLEPLMANMEGINVISCDQVRAGFKHGCRSIESLLSKSADGPRSGLDELLEQVKIAPESDFAVIQFSSGTTGRPKPIPRTHKNLCHLVASVDHEELMDLKPGQIIAGALPITHRPGLWALLGCINGGSTFVLWDNLSDVHDALKMIEKYKVTIFSSSLPFLSMLGNTGISIKDKFDLTSLQHIITSGAKIVTSDLPKSIVKEFKLKSLRQCFGMTESGWVFLIEYSLGKENYFLSVGHVVPGTQAIIMDRETHKPVGMDVRGEIALKGPQIFPGYLTGEPGVFNRADFTDDGYFRTGDQGYFDWRELVYIEGRYKELLIFENGGRFFPNEIEAVINEHPSIEGSCVVKIGEFKGGHAYDIARAFVTLRQGRQLTEKELLDFISERSFEIQLVGGIRILDKFPRLTNGKVDKQTLKNMD